jgi:hypothetical protein
MLRAISATGAQPDDVAQILDALIEVVQAEH